MSDAERTLPHNLDAERSVLGSILLHDDVLPIVIPLIRPADFFRDAHGKIFSAMLTLDVRGVAIDLVTIAEELRRTGDLENVGGPSYIGNLVDGMPRSANVEDYARIVKAKSTLRLTIFAANKLLSAAYEAQDSPDDMLDQAQAALTAIAHGQVVAGGPVSMRIVMGETMDELDRLHKDQRAVTGVPTGLTNLDHLTRGFQKGDLVVIAARPSMGKTSLALSIAGRAMQDGLRGAVFSLEMGRLALGVRLLASAARIDHARLTTGALGDAEWKRIAEAMGRLTESGFSIDDGSSPTVADVRARARRLKATHGLDLVIIDYLQLMRGAQRAENKNLEVAEISRALKGIAKDLDVPVLLLSQLSRAPEQRTNHRPQLSDLRDSGSIEQDADVVLFIYREEKYDATASNAGVAEIIVSKHRNGETGSVKVAFVERLMRFENLARGGGDSARLPYADVERC